MGHKVSIVIEKEDSWYVSHCLELGVTSQGKTIEEAIKNIKEAVELYLEHAEPNELKKLKTEKEAPIVTTISIS